VASAHGHASKAEKAQEAQAQKIVQGCVDHAHGLILTKRWLHSVEGCIAPKGHTQALEVCVEKGLIGVHSKAGFEAKAAQCAEKNR